MAITRLSATNYSAQGSATVLVANPPRLHTGTLAFLHVTVDDPSVTVTSAPGYGWTLRDHRTGVASQTWLYSLAAGGGLPAYTGVTYSGVVDAGVQVLVYSGIASLGTPHATVTTGSPASVSTAAWTTSSNYTLPLCFLTFEGEEHITPQDRGGAFSAVSSTATGPTSLAQPVVSTTIYEAATVVQTGTAQAPDPFDFVLDGATHIYAPSHGSSPAGSAAYTVVLPLVSATPPVSLTGETDSITTIGPDLITDEFWEVDNGDGTGFHTLNTLAYNISTLQGRLSIPPRRGDNFVPARRPGQGYISKVRDARPLSLAMSIVGRKESGVVPLQSKAQMVNNYMKLQQLFAVYNRQITIRKRFYELQDDGVSFTMRFLTCTAEMTGTMEFNPSGPTAGKCVIELTMHDPVWYSVFFDSFTAAGQTTTSNFGDDNFGDGVFGGLIPVYSQVDVSGTAPTSPVLRFDGPVTNPSVSYQAPGAPNEQFFMLATTIASGDSITVDMKNRTIFRTSDAAYHAEFLSPGAVWFELEPGLGTLRVYAESTYVTSDVYVQWHPAYY